MRSNKVWELRQEYGVTQEELASACGISRSSVTEIERGHTPAGDVVLKISAFFNKDPRYIFYARSVLFTAQDVKAKKLQKQKERMQDDSNRSKSSTG